MAEWEVEYAERLEMLEDEMSSVKDNLQSAERENRELRAKLEDAMAALKDIRANLATNLDQVDRDIASLGRNMP